MQDPAAVFDVGDRWPAARPGYGLPAIGCPAGPAAHLPAIDPSSPSQSIEEPAGSPSYQEFPTVAGERRRRCRGCRCPETNAPGFLPGRVASDRSLALPVHPRSTGALLDPVAGRGLVPGPGNSSMPGLLSVAQTIEGPIGPTSHREFPGVAAVGWRPGSSASNREPLSRQPHFGAGRTLAWPALGRHSVAGRRGPMSRREFPDVAAERHQPKSSASFPGQGSHRRSWVPSP